MQLARLSSEPGNFDVQMLGTPTLFGYCSSQPSLARLDDLTFVIGYSYFNMGNPGLSMPFLRTGTIDPVTGALALSRTHQILVPLLEFETCFPLNGWTNIVRTPFEPPRTAMNTSQYLALRPRLSSMPYFAINSLDSAPVLITPLGPANAHVVFSFSVPWACNTSGCFSSKLPIQQLFSIGINITGADRMSIGVVRLRDPAMPAESPPPPLPICTCVPGVLSFQGYYCRSAQAVYPEIINTPPPTIADTDQMQLAEFAAPALLADNSSMLFFWTDLLRSQTFYRFINPISGQRSAPVLFEAPLLASQLVRSASGLVFIFNLLFSQIQARACNVSANPLLVCSPPVVVLSSAAEPYPHALPDGTIMLLSADPQGEQPKYVLLGASAEPLNVVVLGAGIFAQNRPVLLSSLVGSSPQAGRRVVGMLAMAPRANILPVSLALFQANIVSPRIVSTPPNATVLAGSLFVYVIRVVASNTSLLDAPTFCLGAGPANMTVDPLTGLLSWAVPADTVGDVSVPVTISVASPVVQQSFVIAVRGRYPAPLSPTPVRITPTLIQLAIANASARLPPAPGSDPGPLRMRLTISLANDDAASSATVYDGPFSALVLATNLVPSTFYKFVLVLYDDLGDSPPSVGFVARTSADCALGYRRDLADETLSTCLICEPGSFSNVTDAPLCLSCPSGATTLAPGAVADSNCTCQPGFFAEPSGACRACPAGGECAGLGRPLVPQNDFFLLRAPAEIVACPKPGSCRAGGCASGYTGLQCAACAASYALALDTRCVACARAPGVWAAVFVLVLVGFASASACAVRPLSEAEQNSERFRHGHTWLRSACLALVRLQALVAIGRLLVWPAPTRAVFSAVGYALFETDLYWNPCLDAGSMLTQQLLRLVVFPALFVCAALATCLVLRAMGRCRMADQSFGRWLFRWAALAVPLTYLPLCVHVAAGLRCVQLADGLHYFERNPSQRCAGADWVAVATISVLALLIGLAGPLGALAWLLARAYRSGLQTRAVRELYAPLVRSYRTRAFAFELVELLWRLVLGFIVVFGSSAFWQLLLLALLLLALFVVLTSLAPHHAPLLNLTEALACLTTVLLLLLGLAYRAARVQERLSTADSLGGLTTLALLLAVAVPLCAAGAELVALRRAARTKLTQRELAFWDAVVRDLPDLRSQRLAATVDALRLVRLGERAGADGALPSAVPAAPTMAEGTALGAADDASAAGVEALRLPERRQRKQRATRAWQDDETGVAIDMTSLQVSVAAELLPPASAAASAESELEMVAMTAAAPAAPAARRPPRRPQGAAAASTPSADAATTGLAGL